MLKSSGAMAAATLTSRVLGMVREMVYAAFMGNTWGASAFITTPQYFADYAGKFVDAGVSLVGGDLEMGATGTITHIDGDRFISPHAANLFLLRPAFAGVRLPASVHS